MNTSVVHAEVETQPYEFTLENGVRVVVAPDFRSPVVVHMVWYRAGSVDEPKGKTGIAHMLEHMMFKGTEKVKAGDFSKIIARLGGQDNAFTSADYTAYYQKISRENLTQAVEMETDRMVNLSITNETFLPERNVVLEERNSRVDTRPTSLFYELFNQATYQVLPYKNPVIGWREDIENYTLKDAQDWYSRFYAPRNAIVILAGAVSRDEAEWLAENFYAPLENPIEPTNRPHIPYEPERDENIRFEHEDARTTLPLLVLSYRAPSFYAGVAGTAAPDPQEVCALYILSDIAGGGTTSDLYQDLVVKQKLADAVSVSFSPLRRYETSFDVVVQPKAGTDLKKLEAEVLRLLQVYIEKKVSEDDLNRSKIQMKSSDVFNRDEVFETAYEIGMWLTTGGDLEGYEKWLDCIKEVSAEDIQDMAEQIFVNYRKSTGILRPTEKR